MTFRKTERPEAWLSLAVMLAAVVGAVMFVEGAKVRQCPPQLQDGRALLGVNLRTMECRYSPLGRPLDVYSPKELRGIAAMRDRDERNRKRK